MRHYQRGKGFPGWFQLGRYSETKQFKASDWLAALRIRKNIWDAFIGLEKSGLDPCYAYQIMPETQRELAALRSSPLDFSGCGSWAVIAGDFSDSDPALPVRGMKFSDVVQYRQEAALSAENGQRASNPWVALESWPKVPGETLEAPLGAEEQFLEPLVVDMRATNAVLIKAFESWLKNARGQRRDRSKQKRPSYASWSRNGLLPYIDLRLWRIETRSRRSRDEMAEAVGYRKSDENFRSMVVDVANRLMADLGELEALAAEEDAKF